MVVAINVLILKLGDFVEEDSQLVGDIGNIFITCFAPDRQLLLVWLSEGFAPKYARNYTYCDLHALLGDLFQAAHHVLLHLNELGELLSQIRAKGTCGLASQGMTCTSINTRIFWQTWLVGNATNRMGFCRTGDLTWCSREAAEGSAEEGIASAHGLRNWRLGWAWRFIPESARQWAPWSGA